MKTRINLPGSLRIELTCPDPEFTLNTILQKKIKIFNVTQINALSFQFTIRHQDHGTLEHFAEIMGCKLKIVTSYGPYWKLKAFSKRYVLLCFFLILVSSAIFLPTRILFVEVEGNVSLPSRQILSAAESCGIRFGASRKQVRSEKVKNALLSQLTQLQWVGVNTRGCTALISVRERTQSSIKNEQPFSNLIATQDGYIQSQIILRGTPMFSPGDSVTKGQVLVSGYIDCGICIRAGRAEGEIFAQTNREISAITPSEIGTINAISGRKYKISLIFRKKRINLWKDSRISDTGCGRMYEEYFVSLPGGFRLPIALCVDQYTDYDYSVSEIPADDALVKLQNFSDRYLLQQAVAGQILNKQQSLQKGEGIYMLESRYNCTEMICEEQGEQIGDMDE